MGYIDDAVETNISKVYPSEKNYARAFAHELCNSEPPQATSDALLHAVLSINPHSVYYPGNNAYIGYIVGHMVSDDWMDSAMSGINYEEQYTDLYDPAFIDKVRK